MSEPLISSTDSIDDNYGRLLRRFREWDRELKSGRAICHWCSAARDRHLSDGSCSAAVSSRSFRAVWQEDYNRAGEVLDLIELILEHA